MNKIKIIIGVFLLMMTIGTTASIQSDETEDELWYALVGMQYEVYVYDIFDNSNLDGVYIECSETNGNVVYYPDFEVIEIGNGYYYLIFARPGFYHVTFHKPGYQSKTQLVAVLSSDVERSLNVVPRTGVVPMLTR